MAREPSRCPESKFKRTVTNGGECEESPARARWGSRLISRSRIAGDWVTRGLVVPRLCDRGEIAEVPWADVVQKCQRCHEQVMCVVADKSAFEQRGDGAVACRAADELDAGTGDRLAIGDDGMGKRRAFLRTAQSAFLAVEKWVGRNRGIDSPLGRIPQ
jgi:hypothetical protein